MEKKIAIGILAFNVEKYIENVVEDLASLGLQLIIIDDSSTDQTLKILKRLNKQYEIIIIKNEKNIGAGLSTKKLIERAKKENYDMLLKVDGDGQFMGRDVKKIVKIAKSGDYQYIKSNRFWQGGIKGNIPKKRFFGNLLATIFMQITTGTNKLFDPLNGLFAISTDIIKELNKKYYPKRYGYPYFLSVSAVINDYKTYQVNNVVIYDDQESNLKSLKVLYTIIKLTVIFYFRKIKIKKGIGIYQRSAFIDMFFIFSLLLSFYLLIQLFYIVFVATSSLINPGNLLFLFIFSLLLSIVLFVSSFKEEKAIRNDSIDSES